MEKIYYETEPTKCQTIRMIGAMLTVIRVNIEACTDEEHVNQWQCEEITYPHKEPLSRNDYGSIISAIIRAKYSADDVEAIQQNYMESKTTEHKEDFYALRDWRKMAKEVATELTNTAE